MSNQDIHSVISTYFDNPRLTKVDNQNRYSIYTAKNTSLLSTTHRYITAIVPEDTYFIGTAIPLNDLKWASFQTRAIPDNKDVVLFSYIPKKVSPYNTPIHVNKKEERYYSYITQTFPIQITLLKDSETQINTFPDRGTLNSALETYSTIIQLV